AHLSKAPESDATKSTENDETNITELDEFNKRIHYKAYQNRRIAPIKTRKKEELVSKTHYALEQKAKTPINPPKSTASRQRKLILVTTTQKR
ncbi:21466_t:CDS:1, partial [Gigaspora margarita]